MVALTDYHPLNFAFLIVKRKKKRNQILSQEYEAIFDRHLLSSSHFRMIYKLSPFFLFFLLSYR